MQVCIGSQAKLFFAMTLVYCAFIGTGLANHPFHVSTAEVEFNTKTKRLEVGLKCQTTDLERALRLMAGKKIDIENDPQVDELLTRYVTENFYLVAAPANKKAEAKSGTAEKATESDAASSGAGPASNLPSSTDTSLEIPEAPKETIKLVGKEFETKWIWIYFELQPPAGEEPLVLVNRVLFEVNTGQINTCLIRHSGKRHALKSTANKPLQDFDRNWLTASTTEK